MTPSHVDSAVCRAVRRTERGFRAHYRATTESSTTNLPPSLRRAILTGWDDRYPVSDVALPPAQIHAANSFAADMVKGFGASYVTDAYDEDRIRDHAENYAMLCACMDSLEECRRFTKGMGIEPPQARGMTPEGERARWIDPRWWRRQLRRAWTRRSEDGMRAVGMIRKGRQPYASDEAVRHRAARTDRTREWLESRVMVNEQGEQLDLLKVHEASTASAAIRRTELMVRARGFELLAKELGHVGDFATLTAPSAFHAQHSRGGTNEAWERAGRPTVRDAQLWLRRMWERARAKLARLSIIYYGIRVVEAHHDGTPHWHLLFFTAGHNLATMRAVLRGIWLSEFSDEPGADHVRCDFTDIDASKGSAVGYLAKYVAKNIDGHGGIGAEQDHETGRNVAGGLARVGAWASAHRVRQFQQIGGPPVGLWRELRRVRAPVAPALIESVRAPASDRNSWCDFIGALGGIERARRRVSSVRGKFSRELRRPMVRYRGGPRGGWRLRPAEDHELPAVWLDRTEARVVDSAGREVLAGTRYGEVPAPRAAGICSAGLLGRYVAIDTRPHRWRIERKTCSAQVAAAREAPVQVGGAACLPLNSSPRSGVFSALGPVAITVRSDGAPAMGAPAAWTSRETSMAGPNEHQH